MSSLEGKKYMLKPEEGTFQDVKEEKWVSLGTVESLGREESRQSEGHRTGRLEG